jgi:hypothetical protein
MFNLPFKLTSKPLRYLIFIIILLLIIPSFFSFINQETNSFSEFSPGIIEEPADGITIVSIQGFHFEGKDSIKKPARLVAFDPVGNVLWVHNGSSVGARWFYDVDPLPNGNILVLATAPDETLIYELNANEGIINWIHKLPFVDTHDVDLISKDQLLIANMRNYNPSTNLNDDRLLIYNLTTQSVEWEWLFRDHGFKKSGGGRYSDDWTHVNDVDLIHDKYVMASVRNFDQVILIDISTKDIVLTLGSDGDHNTLSEQHNPQYIPSTNGNQYPYDPLIAATILTADSENDRIVEYEYRENEWHLTWELVGNFSWPRDADRLPNGNTLIVDSLNHRVIEVTPYGKIIWEVHSPWGPYDAERISSGDEGHGYSIQTSHDMGVSGRYQLQGENSKIENDISFEQSLSKFFDETPLEQPVNAFSTRWSHVAPWIYPVWMSSWDFARSVLAIIILLIWISIETFRRIK